MPRVIDARVAELKALANEFRLLIYELVLTEELGVNELARIFRVQAGTISQHLDVLLQVDLVAFRAEANQRIYRVVDAKYGRELIALLNKRDRTRKPGGPNTLKGRLAAFLRRRAEDAAGPPIKTAPLLAVPVRS